MKSLNVFSSLMFFFVFMTTTLVAQSPERFAKELLSNRVEYGLTISPDKKTIYFVKTDSFYVSTPRRIYKSEWEGSRWSTPVPAAFSEEAYGDSSPFIAPNGKRLFFTSRRPVDGKAVEGGNIWYVDLEDGKEGEPQLIRAVRSEKSEYSPTVDRYGNLYFGSYRDGGVGYGDLWWSAYHNGGYQTPQNLGPAINTPEGEWGSCIDPEGQFIIFENSGNEGNLSPAGDLYIASKSNGQWQKPVHLPEPINSIGSDLTPRIHGEILYYSSNRPHEGEGFDLNNVDLYSISLDDLLKSMAKE